MCTILMSYLLMGEPHIGMRVRAGVPSTTTPPTPSWTCRGCRRAPRPSHCPKASASRRDATGRAAWRRAPTTRRRVEHAQLRAAERRGQPAGGDQGAGGDRPLSEPHQPHLLLGALAPGRLRGLRQAREPQPHRLLQDPRGCQLLPAHVQEELEAGVLVATRGNHGLAMAWAGRWFTCPARSWSRGQQPRDQSHSGELRRRPHSPRPRLLRRPVLLRGAGRQRRLLLRGAGQRARDPQRPGHHGAGDLRRPARRGRHHLPHRRRFGLRLAGQGGPGRQSRVEIIGVQPERAAAFYESRKKGERVRSRQPPTRWPTAWRRGASSSCPSPS